MPKVQMATSIDSDLFKELKVYAAENDWRMNDVLENALYLWMAIGKDKGWNEIADCMPGSRKGSKLQCVAYDLGV